MYNVYYTRSSKIYEAGQKQMKHETFHCEYFAKEKLKLSIRNTFLPLMYAWDQAKTLAMAPI